MDITTRREAREHQSTYYFTGKACVNGHTEQRFVSTGGCKGCLRDSETANKHKWRDARKAYRDRNRWRAVERNREWRRLNPDKVKESRKRTYNPFACAVRYQRSREKMLQTSKNHRTLHKSWYAAHAAKRRAAMKQATPGWFEHEAVRCLYDESARISQGVGELHEVDHTVPLQHDLVCGLHCIANLRIITATENRIKNNTFVIT